MCACVCGVCLVKMAGFAGGVCGCVLAMHNEDTVSCVGIDPRSIYFYINKSVFRFIFLSRVVKGEGGRRDAA